MQLHGTAELPDLWPAVVAHEQAHYGKAGYIEAKEVVLGDWWSNKSHWWVGLAEGGVIRSSLSFTLMCQEDWLALMACQDKGPKFFTSYGAALAAHREVKPVLYLSGLIVGQRSDMPWLFKAMSRQLRAAQEAWEIDFNECYSIGLHKRSKFLLERLGFEPVGLCRGMFGVYKGSRKKSAMLNALLG